MRRLIPVLLVLLLAVGAAGCGGETSREDFEAQVRESRDTTDQALRNIALSEDWDQLLLRIRAASDQIGRAAEELDEVGAPDELEDEHRELVLSLRGLSEEVGNTATALEEEPAFQESPVSALEFAFWDRTQNALAALREQGVDAPPLGRHAPEQGGPGVGGEDDGAGES